MTVICSQLCPTQANTQSKDNRNADGRKMCLLYVQGHILLHLPHCKQRSDIIQLHKFISGYQTFCCYIGSFPVSFIELFQCKCSTSVLLKVFVLETSAFILFAPSLKCIRNLHCCSIFIQCFEFGPKLSLAPFKCIHWYRRLYSA